MVSIKTYEKTIKTFFSLNLKNFNSLNTVTDVKEFLFFKNKPLNFNPNKSPNSQTLPNIVKLNFAINILSTHYMKKNKTVIGDNPFFYNLDQIEGYDIDTEIEFKFAEYLFKNSKIFK